MGQIQDAIANLPTLTIDGQRYCAYEAVIAQVATCLWPGLEPAQIDEDRYQHVVTLAEAACWALGYQQVVMLSPPVVSWANRGRYWTTAVSSPPPPSPRFALGQIVMTPGVAALELDLLPYLARHQHGDWGMLDPFDQQQNEQAVENGQRILSAYDLALPDGTRQRLWIIMEADRRSTCCLLPCEY